MRWHSDSLDCTFSWKIDWVKSSSLLSNYLFMSKVSVSEIASYYLKYYLVTLFDLISRAFSALIKICKFFDKYCLSIFKDFLISLNVYYCFILNKSRIIAINYGTFKIAIWLLILKLISQNDKFCIKLIFLKELKNKK